MPKGGEGRGRGGGGEGREGEKREERGGEKRGRGKGWSFNARPNIEEAPRLVVLEGSAVLNKSTVFWTDKWPAIRFSY